MEVFGLELRKNNYPLTNLYKDVDRVLKECNSKDLISREVKNETVRHTLTKLFKPDSYFSICEIKNLSSLTGIIISSEKVNFYSSIHCMSWSEMTPEFRSKVVAFVLDDFRSILNPDIYTEISNDN